MGKGREGGAGAGVRGNNHMFREFEDENEEMRPWYNIRETATKPSKERKKPKQLGMCEVTWGNWFGVEFGERE